MKIKWVSTSYKTPATSGDVRFFGYLLLATTTTNVFLQAALLLCAIGAWLGSSFTIEEN